MRPKMISRVPLILACAALIAAAGCGGSSSDGGGENAQEAVAAYVQARNLDNSAEICDLYTDELKDSLQASDCESFVAEHTSGAASKLTIVNVQENGDHATATLQSPSESENANPVQTTIELQKQDGEWKISSLGPTALPGANP
jgi:hypothetical protein